MHGGLPEDLRHLTDQGCRKPVLGGLPEDLIPRQLGLLSCACRHQAEVVGSLQGCRKPMLGALPEDMIQTQLALIKDIVNHCLE